MDEIARGLRALIDLGFRFTHPRNAAGDLTAVVGVRVHHDVIDVVQIFGEYEAEAIRVPGDEMDIFFPHKVFWRSSGSSDQVIEGLLRMPDPIPGEEPTVQGCWVPTRPGRATWLSASA
jgi:hypothetical protein